MHLNCVLNETVLGFKGGPVLSRALDGVTPLWNKITSNKGVVPGHIFTSLQGECCLFYVTKQMSREHIGLLK